MEELCTISQEINNLFNQKLDISENEFYQMPTEKHITLPSIQGKEIYQVFTQIDLESSKECWKIIKNKKKGILTKGALKNLPKERRKVINRISAKKCSDKKIRKFENLIKENIKLIKENIKLKAENKALKMHISQIS